MPISRRVFIEGSAKLAALGFVAPLAARAAQASQITPEPPAQFVRYKVGEAEVTAVYDGVWERPYKPNLIANASVDDVKQALTAAGLPDAFLTLPFTASVVKLGKELILVDSGTGGQVVDTAGRLQQNLRAAGHDPAQITKILISHFHPDHIFGLFNKDDSQAFPNAEILVSDVEYGWWNDPGVFNHLPDDRKPLAKRIQANFPNWKNLTQVPGDREIAPGLSFVSAPGHTPGHRAFLLASGKDTHMFSNDVMYMPALNIAHPDWLGSYDQDAPTAAVTRQKMMDQLAADGTSFSGYHFLFPAYGKLVKDGANFALNLAND